MRVFFVALIGLISCGRTAEDSKPARAGAGAGGVPAGNAGSEGAGAAPAGGSTSTAGSAGDAAGGTTSAAAGGDAAGGAAGGDAAGGDAAGGAAGAGGEGSTIDLTEYACETYPFEECLDGASNESYACCPLSGSAPCVTGFRTSSGDDFRCGNDSCQCASENFYASCHGSLYPCLQKRDCETVWQYEHVHEAEYPGSAFNPYFAQITLLTPGCGAIGIGLDNHRVGSLVVNGLTPCWELGTEVTSQFLLDGESDTLELLAPPQAAPPFEAREAQLELDVYRASWDEDSLLFEVSWRAVACH